MNEDLSTHIKDGFPGQRSVVLPRSVVSGWLADEPLLSLLPSDVGFFPQAKWHYVERPEGSPQLVLIYCLQGEGWLKSGGIQRRVQPGQAIGIFPGEGHSYGASSDDPWTIYWVHMAGEQVGKVAQMLRADIGRPLIGVGFDPALPPLFETMISLLSRGYTSSILLDASLTLGRLVARFTQDMARADGGVLNTSAKIERTLALMEQRLDGQIRISELASHVHLSPSYFATAFKRQTGFAVLDYFLRLKMQRAGYLFDSTTLSIKAIAGQLGYEDALYFSRCFRRVHQCSPTEYRAITKG